MRLQGVQEVPELRPRGGKGGRPALPWAEGAEGGAPALLWAEGAEARYTYLRPPVNTTAVIILH